MLKITEMSGVRQEEALTPVLSDVEIFRLALFD